MTSVVSKRVWALVGVVMVAVVGGGWFVSRKVYNKSHCDAEYHFCIKISEGWKTVKSSQNSRFELNILNIKGQAISFFGIDPIKKPNLPEGNAEPGKQILNCEPEKYTMILINGLDVAMCTRVDEGESSRQYYVAGPAQVAYDYIISAAYPTDDSDQAHKVDLLMEGFTIK